MKFPNEKPISAQPIMSDCNSNNVFGAGENNQCEYIYIYIYIYIY